MRAKEVIRRECGFDCVHQISAGQCVFKSGIIITLRGGDLGSEMYETT